MDTAGNIFAITGVQLEPGSVATPFEHRPFGAERALCQRYYALFDSMASGAYPTAGGGAVAYIYAYFPVEMRATPTVAYGTLSSATNATETDLSGVSSRAARYTVMQGGSAGNFSAARLNNTASAEL